MDDMEEIIKIAGHYQYEGKPQIRLLNALSSLPESKANLKRSIKERIRLLTAAYISLASFVPDDDYEYVNAVQWDEKKLDKNQQKRIFRKVLREMDKLREEIKSFNPFES